MDLSKLSDADLDALEAGRYDLLSDAALDSLEKSEPNPRETAQTQPKEEPSGNAAQAALEGFGQTASMGYLPQLQAKFAPPIYGLMNFLTGQDVQPDDYLKERDANIARQKQLSDSNPVASMVGKGAGMVPMAVAGGVPASLGKAALQGGLMAGAYNPGDVEGELNPIQAGDRALAALLGSAGGAAGYGASKGLEKFGDFAMQAAVGRKKYTPGVGTELAKQGLVGTRDMMLKQAQRGMSKAGETLDDVAAKIPGVDSSDIAQSVWDAASKKRLGGVGFKPSKADIPDLNQMAGYVEDIASRGTVPGSAARGYAKAAGDRAFMGREEAGRALSKQLSKLEQIETARRLKALDPTGQYSKASDAYGALARASKSLSEEASIPRSLMGLASLPGTVLPGVSGLTSVAGQAATKGAEIPRALAPYIGHGLFEAKRKR